MSYEYGYGKLEDELISLFRSGAPDFEAAEKLIEQGADLNADGSTEDNVLSEILQGYWWSESGDEIPDDDEETENKNPELGLNMCRIIRFFLEHGFDVNKFNGCYGAQCLYALTLSTFDKYMIEATKILFDAGARNGTTSRRGESDSTPWEFIGSEGSYQDTCEQDHECGNVFEAVYQMYLAIDQGRPYKGIDSFHTAIGKTIQKVYAVKDGDKPIFYPVDLPNFKRNNCYNSTLYFVYEGGALITTEYGDFWTDTVVPEDNIVEVSEYFPSLIGRTVKAFTFDHRNVVKGTTNYGQPITKIETESGESVTFSTNFGDVKKENRAAFFELDV